MDKTWQAVLLVLSLSILGVIGDVFLKYATVGEGNPLRSRWFLGGMAVFAASTFGWVLAMRWVKLATLGFLYSLTTALFLAASGFIFFGETLRPSEVVGVLLAVVSFLLLARVG